MVVPKEGFVVMEKESVSSAPSVSPLRLQPQFPDFTIPVKVSFSFRIIKLCKGSPFFVFSASLMRIFEFCMSF